MAVFTIRYDMNSRGLPTLFRHRYFTVDKDQRRNWDYDHLEQYELDYRLRVGASVWEQYAGDGPVRDVLAQLREVESFFRVSRNNGARYSGENQYIKCRVPGYVLNCMKKLFVSTLVYDSAGRRTPEPEWITFTFDTGKAEVAITELELYRPADDPYFAYARSAVSTLSVEAIGLKQYMGEEKQVKDFYDQRQMSGWKERGRLSKEHGIADKAGVYMLYDANLNIFYVGKGIKLLERILQHTKNPTDPIPNFTHYRYSVISEEYYEFLYLIENAAIHDTAWLLEMPSAQQYKPSLAQEAGGLGQELGQCRMVNSVEHQTRLQQKQK